MATCKLYKGVTLLGTGAITAGSVSVTSWTLVDNGAGAQAMPAIARRNIDVAITSSTHAGSVFRTRVLADNGSGTLTLKDGSPFAT